MACAIFAELLGAYIQSFTKDKKLLVAVEKGDLSEVNKLLKKGANVDAKDRYIEKTPLMIAAEHGYHQIARLLIEIYSANVNAQDIHGKTALIWTTYGRSQAVIKASLAQRDENTSGGRTNKIIFAHRKGNAQEHFGSIVSIYPTQKGHVEILELLLDNGADVNAQDNDGGTALIWAAVSWGIENVDENADEIFRVLLDNGADVNLSNKNGTTPLKLAKKNHNTVIATVLKTHGARE